MRMKDDATKERKSEERKRKRKQAEEVLSNKKVKQPKLKTRSGRESRQPEQSYKPATRRRFKPIKVKCIIFYSDHMPPMSLLLAFTLFSASDCVFVVFSRKHRTGQNELLMSKTLHEPATFAQIQAKVIMRKIITQTTCHGWAS